MLKYDNRLHIFDIYKNKKFAILSIRIKKQEDSEMFKAGCAEKVLKVPLFIELHGYGFFAGRRNLGTRGELYCRAFSFFDGIHRAMIIYTDTLTTNDAYARELRNKIAVKYSIHPEYITFVATHTHSAPPLFRKGFCGFGIPDPDFQDYWKRTVMEVADAAFYDEEDIEYAEAGKAPLSQKLGKNRVEVEKNITDESIRWVKFIRPDGCCKILLHSHGVHGIATNGPMYKTASSDWAGAANRMIQEQNLADMPLFMLGPCGDINTAFSESANPELGNAADYIGKCYVEDLRKSLEQGGKKITDLTIRSTMKAVRMPVVKQTVEELAADAEIFRSINEYEVERANRIDEMIQRIRKGDDLTRDHDFQVLRIGELSFLFIPGEYFIEDGADMMERSEAEYSFAVTVANGDGGYFPSERCMKRFPRPGGGTYGFGYYEIYSYPQSHSYKYPDNIASFVANTLLDLEKNLK